MKYRVLVSAPYFLPVVDEYRKYFADHDIEPIIADVEERLEEEDLIAVLGDIDGVICGDDIREHQRSEVHGVSRHQTHAILQ